MMKSLFVGAALLLATSAFAGEIDVTQGFTDLDGATLTMNDKPDGPVATLRLLAIRALLSPQIEGGDKGDRYMLAMKIHLADKIELRAEDVTLLKLVASKAYGPLVYGRIVEVIDPAALKK